MPRQHRPVPFRNNRFNYWNYDVSCPKSLRPMPILSASDSNRRSIVQIFKSASADRPLEALRDYIQEDKRWEQDPMAQQVFRALTPRQQKSLTALSREQWHQKSQWSWEDLLLCIARDQAFFRELVVIGPTQAGLVGTRRAVETQF